MPRSFFVDEISISINDRTSLFSTLGSDLNPRVE